MVGELPLCSDRQFVVSACIDGLHWSSLGCVITDFETVEALWYRDLSCLIRCGDGVPRAENRCRCYSGDRVCVSDDHGFHGAFVDVAHPAADAGNTCATPEPLSVPYPRDPAPYREVNGQPLCALDMGFEPEVLDSRLHHGLRDRAPTAEHRVLAIADGRVRIELADAGVLFVQGFRMIFEQKIDSAEEEPRHRFHRGNGRFLDRRMHFVED